MTNTNSTAFTLTINGVKHEVINLTPHAFNFSLNGEMVSIPSSGMARVEESSTPAGTVTINGAELTVEKVSTAKTVTNLPDEQDGVIYIVSRMVCEALPGRKDLYFPFRLIREEGRIVGCEGLGQIG